MKLTRQLCVLAATFLLTSSIAMAQGHGNGHNKHDGDDDGDKHQRYYGDYDRDEMRDWYRGHQDHLPPGLAKKDQLPPGLEKQLAVRGTLPPGLRKKIQPCPEDLERRLPPPPPDCEHVVVGGHLVLMNRQTYVVMDVFHFEIN